MVFGACRRRGVEEAAHELGFVGYSDTVQVAYVVFADGVWRWVVGDYDLGAFANVALREPFPGIQQRREAVAWSDDVGAVDCWDSPPGGKPQRVQISVGNEQFRR